MKPRLQNDVLRSGNFDPCPDTLQKSDAVFRNLKFISKRINQSITDAMKNKDIVFLNELTGRSVTPIIVRQTDKQTGRQADRQAERQTDRRTGRRTDR